MIDSWNDFLGSWSLWSDSYVTALLAAAVLALCGVFVVAQRQVREPVCGDGGPDMGAIPVAQAGCIAARPVLQADQRAAACRREDEGAVSEPGEARRCWRSDEVAPLEI